MLALEPASNIKGGFASYGDALWWTAMLLTTIGTDYWPHTAEGRILCLMLSVYAFAVWGYITASLASFFLGQDSRATRASTVQK
jgi:voltage-gated potassium channel